MTIIEKSPEQLAREDLIRQTLGAAAKRIERESGNSTYMRAWEIAAKWVRELADDLTKSA
jgi:hypothetical protein